MMKLFKTAIGISNVESIKDHHLEMKDRLEALREQRAAIKLDLDTAEASSEPLPADLALIQSLGLLDRRTSLARVAERLTTAANRILIAQGSRPVSMDNTHKYLPTTTSNDHLEAQLSNLAGGTGARARIPKN